MKTLITMCVSIALVVCLANTSYQQDSSETKLLHNEEGLASYYHDKFEGKSTASGQLYKKAAYTAAHRTLAFGTEVYVTRADIVSDTVLVRVNDRGPYVRKRIIDLSRAAAQQIGLVQKGIAPVRIWPKAKAK